MEHAVIEYGIQENYESSGDDMVKEINQVKQNIPMTRLSAFIHQKMEEDCAQHCNVRRG